MNLFYFIGVLWLICWYIYFFSDEDFPYKNQIVTIALAVIILLPFKANFLGFKIHFYFLIFCMIFLYCFLKSSLFMQFSLIASLLIVVIMHFVSYLATVVNPKIFFGTQYILEILIIITVLEFCLKKPLAIFSATSTGIALSEITIQIFNNKIYGISTEQMDSGFQIIAGITLLVFLQFIFGSKGKRSKRRLLL